MYRKKILILEDDLSYANSLKEKFEGIYDVEIAESEEEFWQKFSPYFFDLLILDIRIESKDLGIEILKKIKANYENQPVIMLTQYGESEYFIEAMNYGANLFLEKKDFDPSLIIKLINSLIASAEAEKKVKDLKKEIESLIPINIIGESEKIKKVKEEIKIAAIDGNVTCLILGETGVGKELVARNIHNLGRRKNGNFVAVNISGIPKELLYSTLFGYEKGAFTDARETKKGNIEEADEGVVFFDEIGDLDLDGQVKLLRVLEDKKVRRLGSNKDIEVDVQFLFATNKDLEKLIKDNHFREDLFYRIRQFEIYVPPLRERKEDIPLLCDYFLKIISKGKEIKIDPDVMSFFLRYNWYGNVRELKVVLENAYLRANFFGSDVIKMSHLPDYIKEEKGDALRKIDRWEYKYNLAKMEIELIERAIEDFKTTKKTKLAQILHYPNRFTFMRRITNIFKNYPEMKPLFPKAYNLIKGEEYD